MQRQRDKLAIREHIGFPELKNIQRFELHTWKIRSRYKPTRCRIVSIGSIYLPSVNDRVDLKELSGILLKTIQNT